MKPLMRSLLSLALVLPLLTAPVAAAKPGSFKGGFSSQKASPTSSKPLGSRFGGFGAAKATRPVSDLPRKSAMTADLDRKAAQQRALGSLDARRGSALPPAQPMQTAPLPQRERVIVQRSEGSGWGGAIAGFMLGSMLSSHASAAAKPAPQQENNSGLITPEAAAPTVANPMAAEPADVAAPLSAEADTAGFGTTLLRVLAWFGVLSLLAWGLSAFVAKWRRLQMAQRSHYAFERN